MRLTGITEESFIDGPGLRYVIFTQGCPHRCEHCQNPETWSYEGGQEISVREINRIIRRLDKTKYRGITFSGGEPFVYAKELSEIAKAARETGFDIVVYTGYTFEELLELDEDKKALLCAADILIDGKYIHEQRDIGLLYRGSSNQRIIDVQKSFAGGNIVLCNK